MQIRPFRTEDTEQVIDLWTASGLVRPWNDPRRDIERKLTEQPELFLVGELEGAIVAAGCITSRSSRPGGGRVSGASSWPKSSGS
jgi:ribosomal protein S18 acetylase RimI-like enzyme